MDIEALRKTVWIEDIPDPRHNDCGNPGVDSLARRGAMETVWHLVCRFPLVRLNDMNLWHARRDGRIRAAVEKHAPQLAEREFGPKGRDEWELLAQCCIMAIEGRWPSVEDLYAPTFL